MLAIDLTGKRALIAGVERGFGFAIARALAEAGATVSIATWPALLKAFQMHFERGKLDDALRLRSGGRLAFAAIHPFDADHDRLDDVPADVRDHRRYRDCGDFTVRHQLGAAHRIDHRLRLGGRIASVRKVSRGRRVPRSGAASPPDVGGAPCPGSASPADVGGASAGATGSLMRGLASAVRSNSLPSASRTASTVGWVDASAVAIISAEAPRTSASTSIGVNGSVGVSSVGAVRFVGGRRAVVRLLDRVRRGTAFAAPANRPPTCSRFFRTELRSNRTSVACAPARSRTG